MKGLAKCKFLALMAVVFNIIGFVPLILVGHFKGDVKQIPLSEHFNLIIMITLPLAYFLYFFSVRCFVTWKNQSSFFKLFGFMGPMGLFFSAILPSRRYLLGLVKVPNVHPPKGMEKVFKFMYSKWEYITPEEFEQREEAKKPKTIIENIEAEIIQVKTIDGKILYLKTVEPPKEKPKDDNKEENEKE